MYVLTFSKIQLAFLLFLKIILDHLKATRDLSWDLWVPWRKDLCKLTQPFNIDLGTYLQRRDDIAAERKVQTAYISCSKTLFSYNAKEKRGWVKISSRCLTQSHFNWNLTFIQCTVTKIARVVFLNSVLYYIKLCYQQRSNKHFNGFVVLYQRFLTWTWPTHFTYIFAVSFQRRQNGAVEFFSVPLRNAISWQTTQIFLFNRLCCVPSFKRASKALLQVSQVEGQNSPDLK